MPKIVIAPAVVLVAFLCCGTAVAWHDETHLAVAKAAGYQKWYNAAAPDLAKEKAGTREQYNHYCDLPYDATVSAETVLAQEALYNDGNDSAGHLYGAIVAAVQSYRKEKGKEPGKYAEYHLAYAAHYLADLSQPLHNVVYDDFNQKWHKYCDGIVEDEALAGVSEIRKRMYEIVLAPDALERELAREVARVANESRALARVLVREQRPLTREEGWRQLAHSASLLRALLYALSLSPSVR